jgi:radical SAM protein with 4Fe4S-binding SPASM domain
VCTNGLSLTDEHIEVARRLGRVRFNVSLDGLSQDSHGKFRGNRQSFDATLANTRRLGNAGLLKGILSTPNRLASINEYEQLYALVAELGADYLLMNPLSSFGRGIKSHRRLRADTAAMLDIETQVTARRQPDGPEAVFIRFPNRSRLLSNCIAGDIFYVFVNGDVTVCPYLVFATENPGTQHDRSEFIVGNLFEDEDIDKLLDAYNFAERYPVGTNATCGGCGDANGCGKGCPAAVITNGGRIGDLDREVCPITSVPLKLDIRRPA